MEYTCAVWNAHTEKDCALLDAVQNQGSEVIGIRNRLNPLVIVY